MLLELELPRLLAPDLPSNWSSIRGLNCSHCDDQTFISSAMLLLVTTSKCLDWVIYAPAAFLGCGSRFSAESDSPPLRESPHGALLSRVTGRFLSPPGPGFRRGADYILSALTRPPPFSLWTALVFTPFLDRARKGVERRAWLRIVHWYISLVFTVPEVVNLAPACVSTAG